MTDINIGALRQLVRAMLALDRPNSVILSALTAREQEAMLKDWAVPKPRLPPNKWVIAHPSMQQWLCSDGVSWTEQRDNALRLDTYSEASNGITTFMRLHEGWSRPLIEVYNPER